MSCSCQRYFFFCVIFLLSGLALLVKNTRYPIAFFLLRLILTCLPALPSNRIKRMTNTFRCTRAARRGLLQSTSHLFATIGITLFFFPLSFLLNLSLSRYRVRQHGAGLNYMHGTLRIREYTSGGEKKKIPGIGCRDC